MPPDPPIAPARERRVLIVEDSLSNVRLLEDKLANNGFAAVVAFDGLEALRKLDAHDFDLVLLDVMLPELDGFAVCRALRRHPRAAGAPVIMVTALDSPADRRAGLEAGADDFFVKPVEDAVLFNRVRELVRDRVRRGRARQPAE
jgi:two-component system cell cycle response regulator